MSNDSSRSSHYFSSSPAVDSSETEYTFAFDGADIRIVADRGVFSMRGLDKGTAVLLRHVDVSTSDLPAGDIVDVGCGAGPLTLALARNFPDRIVWGVDVNPRALELTRRNARANGLANVRTATPDAAPASPVAAIWSNPPIRIGKVALHEVLRRWLVQLADGGICRLVVNRNLGGDSLQKWIISEGFACDRIGSKSGFRVLEVSHA